MIKIIAPIWEVRPHHLMIRDHTQTNAHGLWWYGLLEQITPENAIINKTHKRVSGRYLDSESKRTGVVLQRPSGESSKRAEIYTYVIDRKTGGVVKSSLGDLHMGYHRSCPTNLSSRTETTTFIQQ